MRNRKAFTIIELLMVIAIIAIIFSAMGINISSLQNEARISRANADIKTIQLAVESYYKNYMYEFPEKENYQAILNEANPRILTGNYFDPFGETGSSMYIYDLSPSATYYVLYSIGLKRHGEVSVSDSGKVIPKNNAIWVSNGQL